jgi:uncharacterized protein (DUF1330 family)
MEGSTYLMVEATPNPENSDDLKNYGSQAPNILKKHGGVPVANYSVESTMGSGEQPAAFAVFSFPSKQAILDLLVNDTDYQQLIPFRDKAFTSIRFHICN